MLNYFKLETSICFGIYKKESKYVTKIETNEKRFLHTCKFYIQPTISIKYIF